MTGEKGSKTDNESIFAEVLAEVLKVEVVKTDKHFFDDLGADSMTMARFCARLRKRGDVPNISMKDVYATPTISSLAIAVAPASSPSSDQPTASGADVEAIFTEVLAEVLKVETVETDKHFFDDLGADSMTMARFCARLRKRGDVPNISMKDVYATPTISSLAIAVTPSPSSDQPTASGADVEAIFTEVLAEVLKVETVETDKHFFDDLGADSMTMARFCARLRKRDDVPNISMKDVYSTPTIASLAAGFLTDNSVPENSQPSTPTQPVKPATNMEVALCGLMQLAASLVYIYLIALLAIYGYHWIVEGAGYVEIFKRSALLTSGSFVVFSLLPIVAKWALVGRWTATQFRIWSPQYVRFWIVKLLIQSNPLVLFKGTPIYNFYLRALGAKIGRNVVIYSPHVPVCTDLLSIGDNAVVRKDTYFNCYRAHANLIQTGSVNLGKNTVVGEMSVLDIDTALGDGAQIGHSSALYAGQSIPANEHRYGSPAEQKTSFDYADIPAKKSSTLQKTTYLAYILLSMLLVPPLVSTAFIALTYLLADRPHFAAAGTTSFLHWELYGDALLAASIVFFGSMLTSLAIVGTIPRLLNRALEPGKVYPLYGLHYGIHHLIGNLTNIKFFTYLFGDSSYITNYLRWIGYKFPNLKQTGSNFGMDVKHDNPFMVTVGSGTVVADGLSIINADYSSTSFRVSSVSIGSDNFLGNFVAYPANGKTGDNCLLGSKVMVPIEGEIREGLGLLGSPSFDIPRSVARDRDLEISDEEEVARKIAVKNKHNLTTMGLFLGIHWLNAFLMICLAFAVVESIGTLSVPVAALVAVLASLFAMAMRIGSYILFERLSTGFKALKPQECSIYDPYFWFHERYWKMMTTSALLKSLDGTPFKSFAWRLHGMKIGSRVFDDGCGMTERTMITIGDDCTLNVGSIIQPHSQEDGGFKSDTIELGMGCTLGVGSWVHYGTKLGDGSELGVNAFLMKGEEVPAHTVWGDNPARQISEGVSRVAPAVSLQNS